MSEQINLIRCQIERVLQPSYLEIQDESHLHIGHAGSLSGGRHYYLEIASPFFKEQSLLACHRLIYQALGEMMSKEIHALRIKVINS